MIRDTSYVRNILPLPGNYFANNNALQQKMVEQMKTTSKRVNQQIDKIDGRLEALEISAKNMNEELASRRAN